MEYILNQIAQFSESFAPNPCKGFALDPLRNYIIIILKSWKCYIENYKSRLR